MKRILFLFLLLNFVGIADCAAQKRKGTNKIYRGVKPAKDTAEIVDTVLMEFITVQKSFKDQLVGKWQLLNIKKQQKDDPVNITGVWINIDADSTVTGNNGCNNFKGKYVSIGASLLFSELWSEKAECENKELEAAVMKQLDRIKTFALKDKDTIDLKDNTGVTVFECKRM